MLGKLVDFIAGREPVASATGLAGVVTATLGVVAAIGVDLDPELVAAIGVLVTALAGWLARKAVTPVAGLPMVRVQWNPEEGTPPDGIH